MAVDSLLAVSTLDALRWIARPLSITIALLAYLVYRLTYQILLYPYVLSPLRNVPSPPNASFLLGHFPAIMRSEAGIIQREWVKKHGPAVRAVGPFGIERMIMLKPEVSQKILVSDWMEYPRPAFMRTILGIAAGYGLLTVTGNEHKQMRKVMNPAFSISNLMAQTDMYYDSIEVLLDIMKSELSIAPDQGKVFPIYEWMSKVTMDIICDTAFGYRTNSLMNPHNELAEAYEVLLSLQSGQNISLLVFFVSIPGLSRLLSSQLGYRYRNLFSVWSITAPMTTFIDSVYRIRKISAQILNEKISESELVSLEDTAAKKDIMSLLVRAREVENAADEKGAGYTLSDEALVDQVLTFLGAGHETTASGLSWTLWLLANDLTVQSKLRAEVTQLLEQNPRPDYRSLKDLKLLDCVIMESLRLLPPVPMTFRQAAKSDWIDGFWVPKGTLFYVPIRVINTWKNMWGEDAEEFRPERWLELPESSSTSGGTAGFKFMSFLAGPHACIGKTMSLVEMRAVLASLIAEFEFVPAYEGQVAKPTAAVTMKPADNLPLLVKRIRAHEVEP